jgi:hypothetical protein
MGVAEIIGFALCWLLVASLMLWGVFTEHKRGPAMDVGPSPGEWHPSRYGRLSSSDWVVVESCEGGTPEVATQARFLVAAWLASRGIDIDALPPGDIRTEVTSSSDGVSTTRVLVRSGALSTSRRHH